MAQPTASRVSVDVLTLRYNSTSRDVEVAVHERAFEPFVGQLALPGVLLLEGERLVEAAHRAVTQKLGFDFNTDLGQLKVFDEPYRDPRGATLSIAMWAVADGEANWYPLNEVPPLAFDHHNIVDRCRPLLADMLWRDLAFTRALTGDLFPVSAAVAITRSLTGSDPDRGNLNRRLAALPELVVSQKRVVLGRGRPGCLWQWLNEPTSTVDLNPDEED